MGNLRKIRRSVHAKIYLKEDSHDSFRVLHFSCGGINGLYLIDTISNPYACPYTHSNLYSDPSDRNIYAFSLSNGHAKTISSKL